SALPVRYGLRIAARALPRPTVHGNCPTGCLTRDVGVPAEHAHAGGDRFRRRGSTADAYSLRRPAARAPAAQRQRPVLQSLADRIGRRRISRGGNPALARADPETRDRVVLGGAG